MTSRSGFVQSIGRPPSLQWERAPLPADVARCSGLELDDGELHRECLDCRRRTDRTTFPQQAWMAPPDVDVECGAKIAP